MKAATKALSASPMRIPMSKPDLSAAEADAISRVMETSSLSIGPRLEEFESRFASYLGAKHAVGVSSGTAGLHIGVIGALGDQISRFCQRDFTDAIITTPFSFVASSNAILYERALPIFVDVEPQSGNIDPELVRAAVKDLVSGGASARSWLPRTERSRATAGTMNVRAILPVHAFGQPADMDPIIEVAAKYQLCVIEDACEAVGAEYKGKKVGTIGDCGVFAFYPNKQITTGEGGMVTTDRDDWNSLFRSLRNQGRDAFDAWLTHSRLGYNYRMDELSAALGSVQVQRVEELLAKRATVAQWYTDRLSGLELLQTPEIGKNTSRMSWFAYVVRLAEAVSRDRLIPVLDHMGVPSRPYFTPIHLQPFYQRVFDFRPGDYHVAERLGNSCLALPFSGVMTQSEVDYVCEALRKALTMRSVFYRP